MTKKPVGPSGPPPSPVTWRDVVLAVCTQVDWKTIAAAALDSRPLGEAFGESVVLIANVLVAEGRKPKRKASRPPKQEPPTVEQPPIAAPPAAQDAKIDESQAANPRAIDPVISDAAALLGISVEATEKQIRSALRKRLSESRAHPDHGGDGDDAQRLIAARDVLLNHVRSQP